MDTCKRDWYLAYVASLRFSPKNSFPFPYKLPKYLKVGSVVLVKHPIKPRPFWSLAKILKLIPGDDGRVRVAQIQGNLGKTSCIFIANL